MDDGKVLTGGGQLDPFDPAHCIVHQGYTVLVARLDGAVLGEGREGLYDFDTRILSRHRLLLDDREPVLLSSCALSADRWSACLQLARPGGTPAGPRLPQDA